MSRRIAVLPCLASGLLLVAMLGAESLADPKTDPSTTVEVEKPDDPPAAHSARANPQARSKGLRVTQGSYASVQINVDGAGQNILGDAANEPSLAVNPLNPQNMVVGWRQFDTVASNFRQAGWAYTFSGGASWTFPGSLQAGIFRSDPVLDVDSGGVFYYQSLGDQFIVSVFRSTDGGISWQLPDRRVGRGQELDGHRQDRRCK